MAIDGVPVPNPYLADTITVTEWSGSGPYHTVTLRMDFSDPNIAGSSSITATSWITRMEV